MTYISYSDRMRVTVPVGEVDGLAVKRFEVKDPEDWLETDEKRDDVCSPMEYVRMMRDGRECRPGWYTRLVDYKDTDSSGHPTTAERRDHAMAVARIQMDKAERVLINGLGLGMVLAAALTYDHVKHVDVVEADRRVIDLVGPHYLTDPRVNIIHADAYKQAKDWKKIGRPVIRWDVGWSDIWPTISSENLDGMDELHRFYRNRCGWHGMWAREECLDMRRELRAYNLI